MRTLGEHVGRVTVTENVRQKETWERAALQLVRDGEARAAYELYLSHGRIHVAESVPDRRAEVVAEHSRLEERGVDAVILAQRRDEVAALNELARAKAVEAERVHGPGLTVDGKEYQAGDRVLCMTNDRANGVSNGTRGIVVAVDIGRQTLTLERGDHRQVVIDTTRYDAIDRGYAMTVHKAQGMTADVALVVGSDGATREWTYTAMSRGTEATHYYAVAQPPERDRLGVSHAPAPTQPAEERIVHSWERSLQKESALDYPERYRQAEREHTPSALDVYAPATEAQHAALADLGAPELGEHATRLEAALAIDLWSGQIGERGWASGCARPATPNTGSNGSSATPATRDPAAPTRRLYRHEASTRATSRLRRRCSTHATRFSRLRRSLPPSVRSSRREAQRHQHSRPHRGAHQVGGAARRRPCVRRWRGCRPTRACRRVPQRRSIRAEREQGRAAERRLRVPLGLGRLDGARIRSLGTVPQLLV